MRDRFSGWNQKKRREVKAVRQRGPVVPAERIITAVARAYGMTRTQTLARIHIGIDLVEPSSGEETLIWADALVTSAQTARAAVARFIHELNCILKLR